MAYRTREEYLAARVEELEAENRQLRRDHRERLWMVAERFCLVFGSTCFLGAVATGVAMLVW